MDPLLHDICEELTRQGAHTILLYGSRADGSQGEFSDYDIGAFGGVDHITRDTRVVNGEFLDVFAYPDRILEEPQVDHLKFRGSRILKQRDDAASRFLARLEALYLAGPEKLPPDEIQARCTWARKMVLRAGRGDLEGDYRRVWLLTALLEDYFHIRGLWFEGPKKAFRWLDQNDPEAHAAFKVALLPHADLATLGALVNHVGTVAHGGTRLEAH